MYKIVELGSVVPETGEPRVQILDADLVKTASNEIQEFWAKLKPSEDKAYLHVLALSAEEYYGPNNNGDGFYENDLRSDHPSFLKDGNIYLLHVNKDPSKSSGKPIFSFYNENMHRVELVLAVNKKSPFATEIMRRIRSGEQIYVSMGVSIKYDRCSICGHMSKTRAEYCDHARYNLNAILEDGRKVYVHNPRPLKFFDISLVNRPADKTAFALQKIAAADQEGAGEMPHIPSAELGEMEEYRQLKVAAVGKLAEIIKKVDGDIANIKDGTSEAHYPVLRMLRDSPVHFVGVPSVHPDVLSGLSPGASLMSIIMSGGMPSLAESACIAGRHHMGMGFSPARHIPRMFRALPHALGLLGSRPGIVDRQIGAMLRNYGGELDAGFPEQVRLHVAPVVRRRIIIIRELSPPDEMLKAAAEAQDMLHGIAEYKAPPFTDDRSVLRMLGNRYGDRINPSGPGRFDTFYVKGDDGETYSTTRWDVNRHYSNVASKAYVKKFIGALLGLASLGLAAVNNKSALQVLATPALAIASAKILTSKDKDTSSGEKVQTLDGYEVPASAVFHKTVSGLTKQGSIWLASDVSLGLDYATILNNYI